MNIYKTTGLLCDKRESDYKIVCPDCNYKAVLEDGWLIGDTKKEMDGTLKDPWEE